MHTGPSPAPWHRHLLRACLTGFLLLVSLRPLAAQEARTVRLGISAGGMSTLGLLVEYVDGHGSTEFSIGTWSFRDLSVSLVRRQYFGVSALRPVVGIGLWGILATPEGEWRAWAPSRFAVGTSSAGI